MEHPNELDQQIENLRTLQQSYDQIAGAAEAYNTGKVQLAQNIVLKGVQAEATETLPDLAMKVAQIAQQPIVMEDGDLAHMYANQLFGGQTNATSPLWNLYYVLAQMKNTFINSSYEHGGNTYNFASLIVCEYYKGYDSLQLQGADAYFTCDGDFYGYASPNHVWHDIDNGKANRWVCFLYTQDGARLDITNTAISPRSMYIGGHIGTIEYFTNGRLTDIVCGVEETDVVDKFVNSGYAQSFGKSAIFHNVKDISNLPINNGGTVVIDGMGDVSITSNTPLIKTDATSLILSAESIRSNGPYDIITLSNAGNVLVSIDGDVLLHKPSCLIYLAGNYVSYCTEVLKVSGFKTGKLIDGGNNCKFTKLIDLEVGALENNLHLAYVWVPDYLADADKKAQLIDNIKNHILARVSDATGSTQLVFTVSTDMYNAIASETITWNDEEMTLADAFLTKNWLLAGA